MYNYFPITFRPPPNDPYGITAQDLKDRLQGCIASTRHFAPHAIPALLDKMDSTSPNVKKDALNALDACIHAYDPDTVSRYSITVWDTLKFEILNAQEEFLSEVSLQVLQSIAQRLSEGVSEASEQLPLAQFLKPITKECNEQLQEPQQKQAKPSQQILSSISAASAVAFTLVVQSVVAPLLTIYQEADGITKQRALLETLVVLFDSAISVFGDWTSRGPQTILGNPLLEFKDPFSEILGQALMGAAKEEVSFRVSALKGFLRLSALRDFFQDNEIGLLVQYLDEILLTEESVGRDDLKREAIAALAEVSKYKPRLIMDITFPAFVATLPDADDGTNAEYASTLQILAQISIEKDIFETLVRRLLSKLTILLHKDEPGLAAYPNAILLTLFYVMSKRKMDEDPNLGLYYNKIVVDFCRSVAQTASGKAKNGILNDPAVLDMLGRLSNLIVRSISKEQQDEVAANVYTLFTPADEFSPIPFATTSTSSAAHRRTMILSTYLLAGLSKDCTAIPHTSPNMSDLLSDLIQRSIATDNEPTTQLAFLRHVALLVNKFLPKTDLALGADQVNALLPTTPDAALNPGVVKTVFWLSKALVLRLAPTTTSLLTSLLSLLSSADEQTSTTASRGFAILLSDDDVLSHTNGATIRLLCKQRVFTTVVPLISTRIRQVNIMSSQSASTSTPTPHIKSAHLTALAGILSTIPPSLVTPELPTLLPLLLQSLDLQTADSHPVRAATLATLAVIIRDTGVRIIDNCGHVHSLVTRLLATASSAGNLVTPTRLRIEALNCLFLLAYAPVNASADANASAGASAPPIARAATLSPLLPVKAQVVRELRAVLDDPKRDVRKAAVDARGAWLRGVDDVEDEE